MRARGRNEGKRQERGQEAGMRTRGTNEGKRQE
jgi:hypothetical protein